MSGVSMLMGQTIEAVKCTDDRIDIMTSSGRHFAMYHEQDCCETVRVEDIVGDWDDIIGFPILAAYKGTNEKENPPGIDKGYQESFTWTFYHFRTIRGTLTIRWYGESNGYYSERVDFSEIKTEV